MAIAGPFDDTGKCKHCGEVGGHIADCAWLLELIGQVGELRAEIERATASWSTLTTEVEHQLDEKEALRQQIRDIDALHNTLFVEPLIAWAKQQPDGDGIEDNGSTLNWGPLVQRIVREHSEHTAEKTRALLHGTFKGYMAGENADSKHWRRRAEDAERKLHHEGVEHSECQQALIDAQATLEAAGLAALTRDQELAALQAELNAERLEVIGAIARKEAAMRERDEAHQLYLDRTSDLVELRAELTTERETSLNDPAEQRAERYAEECRGMAAKLQMLINTMDERGQLPEHVFTFPDGDTWEAQPWPR